MRTRIAIGLVLALGLIASGPGMAVAQISDSGQAAQVQYPDMTTREEPPEENDLPVTGFVAIPLLLTGAVLLAVGGVMHVRTRRE
jgi:LPXTG-motif cell wall-anchored protein